MGDETARFLELIWVRRKQEYFCREGWTGKISLNLKENFFSMRKARADERRRDEPGIHDHDGNLWIPDSRYAASGMTRWFQPSRNFRRLDTRLFRERRSRGPRFRRAGEVDRA